MSVRVLVDVSAHYRGLRRTPHSTWRIEREIGRRLLDDASLHALPVVLVGETMYAIDRDDALRLLAVERPNRMPSHPPASAGQPLDASPREWPTSQSVVGDPQVAAHARDGVRLRTMRSGRRVLRAAARRVIRWMPERARPDVSQSFHHAENALNALLRPALPASPAPPTVVEEPVKPRPAETEIPSTVVHPAVGDVLWTCGPSVDGLPLRWLAETKTETGFCLASLCYDMSFFGKSEWNPGGISADVLAVRTIDQLDASDVVFCVSEDVQGNLCRFARASGRDAPTTRLLPMGTDLSVGSDSRAQSKTLAPLARRHFALAVGSVEARNHFELLLDVWRELVVQPDFELDLIIVGRQHAADSDVLSRLSESPVLRERVTFLDEIDDTELSGLYSSCNLFLCPSVKRDWTLSVGEALAHQCQVICSDLPGMRAASYERALLLDPLDCNAWAVAIHELAAQPRTPTLGAPLPTWDTSASVVREWLVSPRDELVGAVA